MEINGEKFKVFSGEKKQLFFLVALAVLIPTVLFFNTYYNVEALKSIIQRVMEEKAVSIENLIGASCQDIFNNPQQLQDRISQIVQNSSEINKVEVLIPIQNNSFKVIASSEKSSVGRQVSNLHYQIPWSRSEAIKYHNSIEEPLDWQIVSPIYNQKNQKIGLVEMDLSFAQVEQAVNNGIKYSYFFLLISIILVFLLFGTNNKIYREVILAQKIKEIDKMKDEFISMASHELRTPITVIKDYLEEIIKGNFGQINKEIQEPLQIVLTSSNRLSELIEDLLNVSRIEQGRIKINLVPIDIVPFVKNVIDQMKIHADKKNLKLVYQTPSETNIKIPPILADPDRLKQILINLIGNAIKYTFEGRVAVSIKYLIQDKLIEIKVSDTGIGMSAKDQEKLFEKFYRIRNKKTSDISGTGLGLWITKQLVELMSGRILVSSIEGRGSEFSLYFPVINNKNV